MLESINKATQISLVVLVLTFTLGIKVFGTDYYVSNNGNDSNSGTSPAQAWKTLDKVSQHQFSAGDKVLFERGHSWRGTLLIASSGQNGNPVTYGAYGEGEKPVFYGSEVVTGWTQHSENIYKATVSFDVKQVFADGNRIRLARSPNKGYYTVNSVQGNTSFTSNLLDGNFDYTDATWYGRTRYWFGVIRKVASSSSRTLTLTSAPDGNLETGQGFVLMNKLEFLDQAGEWFFNKSTGELYIWTPGGDSPDNYLITASKHPNGVYINRSNYVNVNDLNIREFAENGFYIIGSNYCEVYNNDVYAPELYGMNANGGGSHVISNNTFDRANGGGLYLWIRDSHITDNLIKNTGVFNEIGAGGTGAPNGGSGAEISGENNLIEYNTIENSNYNGLFYRGAGTVIQYNFINNSCLYKDDGGAIYTNTSGSGGHIRYNIILNSLGNPEGYKSTRSMAEGIYIDEIAQNVVVEFNTIQNTGDAAIKLHNVGNIVVDNNTIMKARYGIFADKYVGAPSPITNNLVYMPHKSDDYEPRPLFVRVVNYNTFFDNNKYINPNIYASTGAFRASSYVNFPNWQSATSQDLNSSVDITPLASGETPVLYYNNSKTTKTFKLNGAVVRDTDGNSITSSFSLEPFTSVILVGKNTDNIDEVVTSAGKIQTGKVISCYPNPFASNLTIETGLNFDDKFHVNIYNISGALIRRFTEKDSPRGAAGIQWDGRDFSGREVLPGLYMIRLHSGSTTETIKVFKSK